MGRGREVTSLAVEFWDFLRQRKKWWLAPIVIVLALFGALIVFAQGSAVAPFIYTIF
jgi:drug/metabolite transporter superfamily protein YnfA